MHFTQFSDCQFCGKEHVSIPVELSRNWKELKKMYPDMGPWTHMCPVCMYKFLEGQDLRKPRE